MKLQLKIQITSNELKAITYTQDSIKRYIPAFKHKLSLIDRIKLALGGEKQIHYVRNNLLGETNIKISASKKGVKANIEVEYNEDKVVNILEAQRELYENVLPILISTYNAINLYTNKYVVEVENIIKDK